MPIVHKIKTVKINKFRGIVNSTLTLDGKSLLIKGDNGSGKSSIVDAFEFFFTGEISRFKGIRSLSLKKHAPHVKFKARDIKVELLFNDGTSLIKNFNGNPNPPKQLEQYFDAIKNKKFILHRAEILEFITTRPADRFKSISNIIGVKELDDKELILKRAKDKIKGEYDSKMKELDSIFQDLSILLEKKITEENQILSALNEFLSKKKFPPIEFLEQINGSIEDSYKSIVSKRQESENSRILRNILDSIKGFKIRKDIPDQVQKIFNLARVKALNIKQEKSRIIDFLKLGKHVIMEEELQICPLCEQAIDNQLIIQKLGIRIKEIYEFTKEASEIRRKISGVQSTLSDMMMNLKNLNYKIQKVHELTIFEDMLNNILSFLREYSESLSDNKKEQLKPDFNILLKGKLDTLKKILDEIAEKSKKLLFKFELTQEELQTLKCQEAMQNVRIQHELIVKIRKELKKKEREALIAEKIYSNFSEIKKAKIQDLYDDLEASIHDFYTKIHPNESYENLKLHINPKLRASTELKIDCFGQSKLDPRAYSSEGHLDTLGLCIFLAFYKRFNQDCPIIILDDVVSTVDNGHRERIADLLLNEFSGIQCIITTCDGIWYEQLRSHQRVLKIENKFKNLDIVDWNIDSGPVFKDFKPDWELIMDCIRQGDKSGAGSKARCYFEFLLKELCERMEVPIPYKKEPRYTLSEFFSPAERRIKKLLKKVPESNVFKSKIIESFEKLKSTQFMFNLLAHDNPEIGHFNLDEVKSFCEIILQFNEVISCPECKSFLKYERTPREIRCLNPKCKNPLLLRLETK